MGIIELKKHTSKSNLRLDNLDDASAVKKELTVGQYFFDQEIVSQAILRHRLHSYFHQYSAKPMNQYHPYGH